MSTKISALTAGTAAGTDRLPVAISPFGSSDNRYLTPDLLGTYYAKSTLAAGTLTDSTPMTLTQTWNDAADTFIGLSIDITNTNSAIASAPFRIRVDSSSIFEVLKTGIVVFTASLSGFGGALVINYSSGMILTSASKSYHWPTAGPTFPGGAIIGWNSNATDGSAASPDTGISRTSSGVLEINSGTTGQLRDLRADRIYAVAGTSITAGGVAGKAILLYGSSAFGIYAGSTAPTIAAGQGSLYLRTDGGTSQTRAYINNAGTTTWVALLTTA